MAGSPHEEFEEELVKFLAKYSTGPEDPNLKKKCEDAVFMGLDLNFSLGLGICLGLSEQEIFAVRNDHEGDSDRVIALFWEWRRKLGLGANYLLLILALIKNKNIEAADKACVNHLKMTLSDHPSTPNLFESRQLSLSSESHPSPSLDDSYKRSVSYTPSNQQKVPPCEKDTTNKAWQVLDIHHDELVDIIRSDARLCTEMMEQLYECFLIGSAEKEVIEQLPSLDIRSKAIMGRVSTFISKARNPIGAFAKFFFVLKNFTNFREINDNLRKEVRYAGFQLRDSSQSTRKTLPPKKLMESSNPDAVTELDDDLVTESISIKKYSDHLKHLYKKQKPDPKWSMESAPSTVYVDLAVLKKDDVCTDPFTKSTIHGIDDDIFQRKDPLSLEDLCSIDYGDAILIEGAPGIGKSMLAFEICKRWVQGNALQNYTLLLLLRLRDKFIQKCQTVRELLGSLLGEQSWKATAIQDIIDNSGKGLIVIFEGFDELPEELTESDSLFFKFARELSGASLVFTSRPSAKHCLKKSVSQLSFKRHVEVIGFTPASIKKYVTEFFKGKTEHIESFYQHLEESPRIGDCLYVPVNLVIICSIFMQCIRNDEQVPLKGIVTSTKLYHIMIRTLLYRHMKSQDPDKKISTPEDLKKLPISVKADFLKVCKIAYDGLRVKKTKLLFYANEDIESDFETLGIMQKETQLYPGAGDVIVYYFLHFTIQEFLAAYHVSQLSQREIGDHFHRFKNVRNLSKMLCFLAGLTELKSVKLSVSRELHNMNAIHCLYESGDETIMKKVFGNSEDHFKVSRLLPKATPHDMYKLGRCIAFSRCHWELSFTLRGVTPDHIEKLQKGLASAMPLSCLIKGLSFSLNPIGDEGMIELLCFPEHILAHLGSLRLMSCELQPQSATELARHFHKFRNLGTFFYHNNRFKEGNQLQLLEAMMPLQCKHVSFSKLSPEECSLLLTRIPSVSIVELYQLGSSSIEALIECLHNSVSLEVMHIEQSQCTKENISQLPKTLPSSILQKLKLINCGIDSDSICIIIEAVLKSLRLETLDLRDNFIDDKGASHLSAMLKQLLEGITTTDVCNKLKYLCIGHNPFTKIGLLSLLKELCNYSKHEKDIDFTLSLCLTWKDYATRQDSYLDAEKYLKFNCNED